MKSRGSKLRRLIDYVVGVPSIYCLSHVRRKRQLPDQILSVGILTCSAIGDTIIASAIAHDLKNVFPACQTTAFVSASGAGVTKLVDGFDKEVSISITRPLRALKLMRANPTDVLIDITPWPRITALVSALSNSRFTVGFRTERAHRHLAFDTFTDHSAECHELENYRALLALVGVKGVHLPCATGQLRQAARLPPCSLQPTIVFHPWASGYRSDMREWPLRCWAALADQLIAVGYWIEITGGPQDASRAEQLLAVVARPDRVEVLAGRSNLMDTAVHIARAAGVVSVNTGTMHLAAAIDRPTIALHGPTDPARWGPLSAAATVLGPGRNEGGAYLNLGFEYPSRAKNCMGSIKVEEVFFHLQKSIELELSRETMTALRLINA